MSSALYQEYLSAITDTCDRTMHEAGLTWRDGYFATVLDMVLASALEMDKRQPPAQVDPYPDRKGNIHAMRRAEQISVSGISIVPSSETQTPIDSSPSTLTSPTFTTGSSPATQPSAVTSPETSFSAPSPFSSSDVSHCPHCPMTFTGTPRNRSSNLRRHIRTTRDHGNNVGLLCKVPGCNAVISRSDNLGKHMRTVHENYSATLKRQGARKRRRDSDDAGYLSQTRAQT